MHEEWSKGNRRRVAPQVVKKLCGGDSEKDTPVPMPNTAVKLFSAESSWGFPPVRVGRCHADSIHLVKISIHFGGLAQLGEHLPYKQRVSGSSPLTSTSLSLCY